MTVAIRARWTTVATRHSAAPPDYSLNYRYSAWNSCRPLPHWTVSRVVAASVAVTVYVSVPVAAVSVFAAAAAVAAVVGAVASIIAAVVEVLTLKRTGWHCLLNVQLEHVYYSPEDSLVVEEIDLFVWSSTEQKNTIIIKLYKM